MRVQYTARVRYAAELTVDVSQEVFDAIEEAGHSLDEWLMEQINDGYIMLPRPEECVWELDDIDVDSDAEVIS